MTQQPVIRTDRLVLRPFERSDAEEVRRLAGAFEIADTTLNIPHPYPPELAESWIESHGPRLVLGEQVTYAIVRDHDDRLVGAIGLVIRRQFDRAEMGYWIGVPYWGNGYCTEAARALLDVAFGPLGLNRVHATHLTRNPASGRVMQKIGMVHEGRARQHVRKWDRFEDLELYGILREEWTDHSSRRS